MKKLIILIVFFAFACDPVDPTETEGKIDITSESLTQISQIKSDTVFLISTINYDYMIEAKDQKITVTHEWEKNYNYNYLAFLILGFWVGVIVFGIIKLIIE